MYLYTEIAGKMKKYIRNLYQYLNGKTVQNEYREIRQLKNENDLFHFQELYLKKLIFHTYKNVPYYQNIFINNGVVVNDQVQLSKFNEIPILTKELLRKHQKELISKDYLNRKYYQNTSGGSTGEPTIFLQDDNYLKWRSATNKFYYQDMLSINESNVKKIWLWGSPKDLFKEQTDFRTKINTWLKTNTVILNSFSMTEKDMKSYIDTINRYQPDLIRGYAGSLYELCKYAEKNNLDLFQPKKLISSAETLTDDMRKKIETSFKTKLYNFYGSRETASIAGECDDGLMHIFSFNNLIEIVDQKNNPIRDGQEGRIIITNLHNYSMPFIRYEIGDMAVLQLKKCSCGNFLPCLKKISGRVEEQFIKRDGSIVIGYFFVHLIGVLLNKGFIKKFKVVQEDYEKIRIYAIIDQGLPESVRMEIEQKIKIQMGDNCLIFWEFVEDIPKLASGKYLYTQSLINK